MMSPHVFTVSLHALEAHLKTSGFSLKHKLDAGCSVCAGKVLDLKKPTQLTRGLRVVMATIPKAVEALDAVSVRVLKRMNPSVLTIALNRGIGLVWINSHTMAFNFEYIAGLHDNPEVAEALSRSATSKRTHGLSADAYAEFTGDNHSLVVSEGMRQVVIHEIGHLMTSNHTLEKAASFLDGLGSGATPWIAGSISRYATRNLKEFIAESYLKYHRGYPSGSMPAEWVDLVGSMPHDKMATLGERVTGMDRWRPLHPRRPG